MELANFTHFFTSSSFLSGVFSHGTWPALPYFRSVPPRCIFRDADRVRAATAADRPTDRPAGDTRAHASHRSVYSREAASVDDLLVIKRPHDFTYTCLHARNQYRVRGTLPPPSAPALRGKILRRSLAAAALRLKKK